MTLHIPDFTRARVLVVGDLMLDRYWQGATARISPEAPVPVVHIDQTDNRPGGSGNVAANIAALGGQVWLDGLVGADEAGEILVAALRARGVQCCFEPVPGLATITKLRVLSRHQQLIRLDFEDRIENAASGASLLQRYAGLLERADLVVLSDYAKGTLAAVPELIRAARTRGRRVLVDPKGEGFDVYRGATLLTPNLAEFEAIAGRCTGEAELEQRGEALRRRLELAALLITRGAQGMTLLRADQPPLHVPAQARDVYDVTGAGDTVISVLAAALAAGEGLAGAAALANLAAGIAVGKMGAVAVTVDELRAASAARQETPGRGGILGEGELLAEIDRSRTRGERIVMTNGCFDILHAGHVGYLEKARGLGDRLVVAVNDDDSVRRLKGASRPVTPLAQRQRVLAALRCVDWVVSFSEDTPERLIFRVRPEVLVKGGDYAPDEIAGAACVRAGGGEVVILPYEDGLSSSALINSIRKP